jgi:hypothetical protein
MGRRAKTNVAGEIAKWFRARDGEDFIAPVRADPFCVFGASKRPAISLFSTKPGTLGLCFTTTGIPHWLAIVGRPSLPDDADVEWIRRFIGQSEFRFLGDLDPADLMIYVWLREKFPRIRPKYVGVRDDLASKTRALSNCNYRITLSALELEGLRLLQSLAPDIEDVVGPKCSRILNDGQKLELEAVVVAGGLREQRLASALRA